MIIDATNRKQIEMVNNDVTFLVFREETNLLDLMLLGFLKLLFSVSDIINLHFEYKTASIKEFPTNFHISLIFVLNFL